MESKLPDDMNMEILSRTTLKTFDTMRCTSKVFAKLTYSSYLLDLYKQRNQIVSGFLIQNRSFTNCIIDLAPSHESKDLDLDFLPISARILASSEQGIILFESDNPKNYRTVMYHICKPTTKQVVRLPNPRTRYTTVKIAMVIMSSKPLHYKIVRLSEYQKSVLRRKGELYSTFRCEIFDSKAWAWKLMDLVMLPFCVFPRFYPEPVTTKGSIYILLMNHEVLKFDAYSEKWTTFSTPVETLSYPDFPSYTYRTLVKYQGKLGFACKPADGCWEIWVLSTDESWEKVHVFKAGKAVRRDYMKALYDSDTSLMENYNILTFYRFKNDKIIKKVVLKDMPCQMFVFRSDYEPADLPGRRS